MSDLSKKSLNNLENDQKLNNYRIILLKERKRILDRITSLNKKYSSTNLKYAKKVIVDEIDILEFELEKVDTYIRNCFLDKEVLLSNIKNKQDQINEMEYLIKINELPKEMIGELLSKKLDLNSFVCESILRHNLSNKNISAISPNIIEVEKIVEVPKVVEVEKIVEVPKVVEVEKYITVPEVVEVQKIVEVPNIVEVQKIVEVPNIVEVEKVVEVPTLVSVDKVVEVPKIVEVNKNGEGFTINTSEITDSIKSLSEQVSNSTAFNEKVFSQVNETNFKLNELEKSLVNSVQNIQPVVQKEVEPIYIETPVLVQHPYYDNEMYEEEYVENQETPSVDEVQNVVVEEYYPIEEEPAPTVLKTTTTSEEIINPQPQIEIELENTDSIPDIRLNNEKVQNVVTKINNEPVQAKNNTQETKMVEQSVYKEVNDDYFDDDDDFDSAFE